MTDPESLARVRAEFDPYTKGREHEVDKVLKDSLNLESCSELTYLGYVIQETLRLSPVAPTSSPHSFDRDIKVGNLHVKAGESISINMLGLHMNGNQW